MQRFESDAKAYVFASLFRARHSHFFLLHFTSRPILLFDCNDHWCGVRTEFDHDGQKIDGATH
jgi:hypothetical protein